MKDKISTEEQNGNSHKHLLGDVSFVSALFVRENSIYKTLGVDCWDIKRDARKFNGKNPILQCSFRCF